MSGNGRLGGETNTPLTMKEFTLRTAMPGKDFKQDPHDGMRKVKWDTGKGWFHQWSVDLKLALVEDERGHPYVLPMRAITFLD